MATVLATTVVLDGLGVAIHSGVITLEATGNQTTGPFSFANVLLDSVTGTTFGTIKKANTTAVAGDTALVIGLNPLSNQVSQTGVWTAVVSGTTFISGGNITGVVSGTVGVFGTITAVGGGGTTSISQGGVALSSTNGIFGNVLFNNTLVSASVGLPVNLVSYVTLTAVVSGTTTISNVNPNGQTTMANSAPIVIASDQTRLPVSPPLTISTTNTPTLSTTVAYTATQVIGGILTFTAVLGTTTSGIIQSITCKYASCLMTTGLSVSIFKANPAAGTYTDHVAAATNTADIGSLIGTYRLSTALSDLGNHAIYNLDGIGKAFSSATSNLYGVVTSLGTTLQLNTVTSFSVELAVLPG